MTVKTDGNVTLNGTGKTILTLSAVGEAGPQADERPAVDLAPPWDSTPYVPRAERDPIDDELLRELLPTILDQYEPASEAELRALWGDR
jgi:hypothetical protein